MTVRGDGLSRGVLLALLLILARFRVDETAFADPREQLVQFVRVEPDAVVPAGVDDDAASPCVVPPVHHLAAAGAVAVGPLRRVVRLRHRRAEASPSAPARRSRLRAIREIFDDVALQPESAAPATLERRRAAFSEVPADEGRLVVARRTRKRACRALDRTRRESAAAVMAVLRMIAHAGEALRADGAEIPLAEREVAAAVTTTRFLVAARRGDAEQRTTAASRPRFGALTSTISPHVQWKRDPAFRPLASY